MKSGRGKAGMEKPTYEELEQRVRKLEQAESERKQAEKARRESDYEKALILDNVNESIAYLDTERRLVCANKAFLHSISEVSGSPPDLESVKGKKCYEIWGLPQGCRNCPVTLAIKTGEPQQGELTPENQEGWPQMKGSWAINAAPVRNANGNTIGAIEISQDITQRKQAEKKMRLAHEKALTILDSIDSTIYVADMDTHEVLFMNKKMKTDFGGDKTGEICFRAFRKESKPCEFCTNEQLLDNNGDPAGFCTWHDKNPVTGRFYINYDRAVEWTDGRLVRLQIATDITDLKKMQGQLNQAQKMETIGSLAGGIAHDFNNLLSPIVGLSEMMMGDFPPESPEHHNLHEIFLAGKRGRHLVQQILSFSRQSEHHLIPVHIQKVLKEVITFCRATIPANIPITGDIQNDSRPVMADPTQIHQIAMNLITNAYHAVEPAGGTISIQLREMDVDHADDPAEGLVPGRYAMLSVSDTGTGIDPGVIDKIFDPYFTTKEKKRGTGLGLATVYGIVKSCGGGIGVNSNSGKGTTFHVFLPLLEKCQAAEPEKERMPFPTGREHILVVDDEQPIVSLEKQMLERLGYQITCFSGSMDALAAFTADPARFDLVITDMSMPHLTGMQLAGELVAVRPDIPIILCTGFSEKINGKKAEIPGIRGVLMKPVGMKDLAQKVREVLDEN